MYLFRNIDHIPQEEFNSLYSHRISQEDLERVQSLFKLFMGCKKYHNYTKQIRAHQMTAQRYMMILECHEFVYVNARTNEVTNKDDQEAIEFLHFFLKGQSFLYNQIRKMIGVIIQVFRGEGNDVIRHL